MMKTKLFCNSHALRGRDGVNGQHALFLVDKVFDIMNVYACTVRSATQVATQQKKAHFFHQLD